MTAVLKGVKVVELGTMITAPLAAMMLADLGAEVVKVENPKGGDPFRSFRGGIYSPHFVAYNRGKRSVKLDLRTEDGRAALLKLLARADVLIENFRAGVMERLGLTPDVVQAANPRLIHCSITGFGADGPYSARPAYDMVGVALSGIGSLLLDPESPQALGPTIPDNATGMYACYGVLGALFDRERTGKGRRLDVNMLESAIAFIPDPMANYTRVGTLSGPLTRVAASQSYALRCGDGKLIGLHLSSQPKFWEALIKALGRPDLGARRALRDARIADRELSRIDARAGRNFRHQNAGGMDGDPRSRRRAVRAGAHSARRARRRAGAAFANLLPPATPDRRRHRRHSSSRADRRRARGEQPAAADARRAHRSGAGRAWLRRGGDPEAARGQGDLTSGCLA